MTLWRLYELATYFAAGCVTALACYYVVPDLWRTGLAIVRVWLTPDHPDVVSIEDRKRQFDAATGRR